ncbi:MAG: hypothetical protein H7Y38_11510 [Armatimonadetes bacterium]|nr:hypothetical protein [Armatimonadota bacterium]
MNAAAQYKDEYAERVATVKFVKGCFDGIQLEMATGSSPGFVVVGSVLQSPFAHNAAPSATGTPEMRRYRARFVKGNVAVGEYSDIVSVLVG